MLFRWIPLISPFTWVHLIMHLLQLFRPPWCHQVYDISASWWSWSCRVLKCPGVFKGRRDSWGTLRIPFGKIGGTLGKIRGITSPWRIPIRKYLKPTTSHFSLTRHQLMSFRAESISWTLLVDIWTNPSKKTIVKMDNSSWGKKIKDVYLKPPPSA